MNEVGVFPVQNYFKGILPSKSLDIVDDRDRERVKSLIKDLVFTLNDFWKSHKIPFRVREPRKSDLNKFKQKNKKGIKNGSTIYKRTNRRNIKR